MSSKTATDWKDEGNQYFGSGDYNKAIDAYTEGLALEPENHILFSNRAAAYLKKNDLDKAISDALLCMELSPEYAKGYTRLAQAYLRKGDWDKCEETIGKVKEIDPTNRNIQTITDNIKLKKTFEKLKGKWYGKVSEALGGYIQKFDFTKETEVLVQVFGREITAKLHLDTKPDPPHLDLLVENEPGQPQSPEVKHIFKIDENDKLHLCSPYMCPPELRPTEFSGPAYVIMERGEAPLDTKSQQLKEEISKLSMVEKCEKFAKEFIKILPDQPLHPVDNQNSSQNAEIAMQSVKIQTSYFEMKEIYGEEAEECLRQYLEGAVPPNEKLAKIVLEMKKKMQAAGLFPSDAEIEMAKQQEKLQQQQQQQTSAQLSAEAAKKIESLNIEKPNLTAGPTPAVVPSSKTETPREDVKKTESTKKEEPVIVTKGDSTTTILAVTGIAIAVVAVVAIALRRSSSRD